MIKRREGPVLEKNKIANKGSDFIQKNIAVIGTGYWGQNLVRNFHQLGALKLVCDKNENVLEKMHDQYADIDSCIALADVLNRVDIQGVVIATAAETHFHVAREALFAGKHIFVEKPLALNEDQGSELVEIAEKKSKIVMVGHLLQYHPAFIELKRMALSGELGRINYIYSNRLNLGKIRREENILWSFAPHDISMILSLAGQEPDKILTTGGYYLHQKIADVTTTHFEFSTGLHAHIFVSWLHPFKEQKLVVVGEQKMAVFDDTLAWENKLKTYPHRISWENNLPVPNKATAEKVPLVESEPLKNECMHFLQCIQAGRRPLTDGLEGLSVLRVLNASQRSLDLLGRKLEFHKETGRYEVQETLAPATGPDCKGGGNNYFAHESALIDQDVIIGSNTKIWHFSHVLSNSKIGESCNIGQNVVIGPDVTIGKNCKIQNNVSIYKGVTLADGVFCGPSVVFTNIYNPRAELPKMDQVRQTEVKKGATVGANATIVCGVTLGGYCFIGAGAVVTRDVADYALVVGNPAKRIGWMCECGERLGENIECSSCGKSYRRESEGLVPHGL